MDSDLVDMINQAVELTAENEGMIVTLALNYGGRDDIFRAAKALASDISSGLLDIENTQENDLERRLMTHGLPDPDLIIRTSGEQRLSNFLMWQSAYSELYFTDVLWPDFSEKDFQKAIDYYAQRSRRFGALPKEAAE